MRIALASIMLLAATLAPGCSSPDGGLGDGPCPEVSSCAPECPPGCILTQYGSSDHQWYECQGDGTDVDAVCPTCASCQ